MKQIVKPIVKKADSVISSLYSKVSDEKNVLISFLFHALFKSEDEKKKNVIELANGMTVDHFRRFVQYFQDQGYIFISPDDIISNLEADKKYVMITFDDGYYNNRLALPVLEEFDVPAVFFISTDHIFENKSFWWDVQFRNRIKEGVSEPDIKVEQNKLMQMKNSEIEEYLVNEFGKNSLSPVSDIDRPFSPDELKEFSGEKRVIPGNHTSEHAILTNYPPDEAKTVIAKGQKMLLDFIGKSPIIISYPNGNYSEDIIRYSREAGLQLGITVEPYKNYLPMDFDSDEQYRLGRFMLNENSDLIKQCEAINISIIRSIKSHQRRKH
jgi:peptidoglycan/xylan/chitin deacetylase (PgdA/CDA1 family)